MIVLEPDCRFLVLECRPDGLLEIIARFGDRARAERYAEGAVAVKPPAAKVETAPRSLADDIMKMIPRLVDEDPRGATVDAVCRAVGASRPYVTRALNALVEDGKLHRDRRADSKSYHFSLPGQIRAPEGLTAKQNDVWHVLVENSDEHGKVTMARREICARARTSLGGIQAVIEALVRKKYVAELARASAMELTTFRILRWPE